MEIKGVKYVNSQYVANHCNCHIRVVQRYLKDNYSEIRVKINGSYYYPLESLNQALMELSSRDNTLDYDIIVPEFKPKLTYKGEIYATAVELARIYNRTADSIRKLLYNEFLNSRIGVLSNYTRAYYYPLRLVSDYLSTHDDTKNHYVYVLVDINSDMVKIGLSTNVPLRLRKLTHTSGRELKVAYKSPALNRTQAFEFETELHNHFSKWIAHHSRYVKWEWYNIDYILILDYIESRSGADS